MVHSVAAVVQLGILIAFLAGLVSFLSPCVFPLVPGVLSYMAGATLGEARSDSAARWRITAHAIFFVLGFALIFAMLGASVSAVGAALREHKELLRHAAGLLLIAFGIVMTGLLPLRFLQRERRVQVTSGEPALLRSGLIGMAFGAGWSPCIGPVLGSILTLAGASASLAQGVFLLLVYALGLGVPFLLVGLLIDRAAPAVRRLARYTRPISVASGAIIVISGVLIFQNTLAQLSNYAPLINM